MKSQIFYIIPREEEKYKKLFQQGRIWHNKLWLTKKKFIEVFKHYQALIKEQREYYNEKKKVWKEIEQEVFQELKERIEKEPEKKNQHLWFWNNFSSKNYQTYLKNGNSKLWEQGDEPLEEIWPIWENFNSKYEIYLAEQTKEQIVFNYTIPDNIIININKYLFNYLGIWFEVIDYKRINYGLVQITADYSYYWNDYWYCLQANANGVIHNAPFLGDEICQCPAFLEEQHLRQNVFINYGYEIGYDLWCSKAADEGFFYDSYSLVYNNLSDNNPIFSVGDWTRIANVGSLENNINKKGSKLFILKNKRGKRILMNEPFFIENLFGPECKTGNDQPFPAWLIENYQFKNDDNLTSPNTPLFHIYANHLNVQIKWKGRTIWGGNFYEIRNLAIKEISNIAGTDIFFEVGTNEIASVKEFISVKVGKPEETNFLVNTIVSTVAGAALGAATGGIGAVVGAKAGTAITAAMVAKGAGSGATAGAIKGIAGAAVNQMKQTVHTQAYHQEFTFLEFAREYLRTEKPLSFVFSQNNELISRYWANRTIKKAVETNQYFNVANFGALMEKEGFMRFHFHTLNMYSLIESNESKDWFQSHLSTGVQLIGSENDPIEWYQTKLPRSNLQNTGSRAPGSLDIMEVKKKETILDSFDPSKAKVSFVTYFRVPNDSLYKAMCIGQFSSHHNGPGGSNETANTKFSNGKNEVCWGCGLDKSKAHHLPIKNGGSVYTYFDSSASSETHITVPNNCTLIVDPIQGNIRIEEIEQIKRHIPGDPPEGFDKPIPTYIPSGGGMPDDAFDPSTDPDLNIPEPDPVDPGGGEPEIPPMEPDNAPEPDPTPEPDLPPDTDPDKPTDPDITPDKGDKDPGNDDERPEDFD